MGGHVQQLQRGSQAKEPLGAAPPQQQLSAVVGVPGRSTLLLHQQAQPWVLPGLLLHPWQAHPLPDPHCILHSDYTLLQSAATIFGNVLACYSFERRPRGRHLVFHAVQVLSLLQMCTLSGSFVLWAGARAALYRPAVISSPARVAAVSQSSELSPYLHADACPSQEGKQDREAEECQGRPPDLVRDRGAGGTHQVGPHPVSLQDDGLLLTCGLSYEKNVGMLGLLIRGGW